MENIKNVKNFIKAVKIEYFDYAKDKDYFIDFGQFVSSRIEEIESGIISEVEYYSAIEEILLMKGYIKLAS